MYSVRTAWCVILLSKFFFFFKQKTAYEMRISDWSSDVCSSDLWPDLFSTNIAIQYGAIKRDRLRFFFCQNQCFGNSHGRIAQRFQKILQHHADHRLVFNDEYCLSVSHFAPCPNIWNSEIFQKIGREHV